MEPTHRHFADQAAVPALVAEIAGRHGRPAAAILDDLARQLREFFDQSFASDTAPSRFAAAGSALVRPRALVALSGGIDSAVAVFLAVRALGREAVLPVTMPGRPGDESPELAALVRDALGFDEPDAPYLIDLAPLVAEHMRLMSALPAEQLRLGLSHADQRREQKMRSGNFASRARVAVLSDLQRAIRGRIIGTVNRTEYCQGYGTKFGTPISYDFGLLNELYKVEIYELGRLLGVPQLILDTPPSTGYFEGQTHAGELGASIEEQDIFAYLLFERRLSPDEIAARYGASAEFARVMERRWHVSAHKRALNGLQPYARVAASPLML
ncbi:MAG TPA: NAD(+) synthase [Herpetosiphonaceae bacterium]